MRNLRVSAACLVLSSVLCAQPAFEAVIIKPNDSGSGSSSSHGSKGQIVMSNQSLRRLIERAYLLNTIQLSGPRWIDDMHFDISAKYPPNTKDEDRPLMLRALLAERFHLTIHHETKEVSGYALVVGKKGFKLKAVDPAGGADISTNGGAIRHLVAKKTSMADLAALVTRNLGEITIDRTDLKGAYDFEFRWAPDEQKLAGSDEDVPSLFEALQEVLGLRLQPGKVPVEITVVDHIDRTPADN